MIMIAQIKVTHKGGSRILCKRVGGAQFSIRKVFLCERRKHDAMLGGPGHATPEFFENKTKQTVHWCILGHILACITVQFLRVF